MSQVLQTNGNYTIKTSTTGVIRLDTGDGVGEVRVTGNLIVDGVTVTVDAQDLSIKDNAIVLNSGELGNGVTLQYSGFEIDRGVNGPITNQRAVFLFNEASDTFEIAKKDGAGILSFLDSGLKLRYIRTDPNVDGGDLTLIGQGTGLVKVTGTTDYLSQILNTMANPANPPASTVTTTLADDVLASVKYVNYSVLNNPTYLLRDDDTRVIAADSAIHAADFGGGESRILFQIDGNTRATLFNDNMLLFGVEIADRRISAKNTNDDLILDANGTGKIVIDSPIQLGVQISTPAAVSGNTIIYAANSGTGDSGIYFVNTSDSSELTNKNRALLWSILF
jgi:hypothetical protein